MRFEALNQVFKTIAVGGNYRNTCGRCADYWCAKMAMDRYNGKFDRWGETHILQSAHFTYTRPGGLFDPSIVSFLFNSPFVATIQQSLHIEWITSLWHHSGTQLEAQRSWMYATLYPESSDDAFSSVIAHLGEHSMFRMDGRTYLVLSVYPSPTPGPDGMPTLTVPMDYQAEPMVIPLDEVAALTLMKPHHKTDAAEGTQTWRFVPKP